RELACGAVASASGLLAIGSGIVLRSAGHELDHFYLGRRSYPISYPNALAAVFLIGFWPAVVLASRRTLPVVARMLALATATAIASGWLTAQSKGGIVALGATAALVFGLSPMRLRLLPPTLIAAALSAAAYRPLTVHQFEHHPLAGIGSRGFGPAYLQNRHSPDTPARAHSVELDALSELGVVGFALLLLAIVPVFVPVVARMRACDPAATAAFAGGAYWLVHASVDWI